MSAGTRTDSHFQRSGAVVAAIRACRARLSSPPMTADELLDVYLKLGLSGTVAALQGMIEAL